MTGSGPFGICSESIWDLFAVRSGPLRDSFGVRSGSDRGPFGVRSGLFESFYFDVVDAEAQRLHSNKWHGARSSRSCSV